MRRWLASVLAFALLASVGCKRIPTDLPYVETTNAVPFDIAHVGTGNGITGEWIATYTAQNKIAHFRIVIGPTQMGSAGVEFGEGRFVSMPDSDASILISKLKTALEAKKEPKNVQRVATLPFTLADIGDNLSRSPGEGGGFFANPPGGWTAIKIFFKGGDSEDVELFLNLNPHMKKGEFSIKDADYGDAALGKLASVL
jgi:hypothetical protein